VAYYLDTSALVKLVVAESETAALQSWLGTVERDPVASDLVRTELLRAVRRALPERMERARTVLNSLTLLSISTATFEQAGRLDPLEMRSLDALHLAVALELGDDLDGLVTHDDRLADAARLHGIHVEAPA
jgi:predicted nucleic acid-binding protein